MTQKEKILARIQTVMSEMKIHGKVKFSILNSELTKLENEYLELMNEGITECSSSYSG